MVRVRVPSGNLQNALEVVRRAIGNCTFWRVCGYVPIVADFNGYGEDGNPAALEAIDTRFDSGVPDAVGLSFRFGRTDHPGAANWKI